MSSEHLGKPPVVWMENGARDDQSDSADGLSSCERELRDALAGLADAESRLARAEERAAGLHWELESIRAGRYFRMYRVLVRIVSQRGRARLRLAVRLPVDALRVLRSPGKRPKPPESRERAERTRPGWDAYAQQDYYKAIAEAGSILQTRPNDYPALELKQAAHWRQGDITATVATLRRMRAARDSAALEQMERSYAGRAIELDARWRPRILGSPRPVEPQAGVIMHLLKESIPYHVNGFTTRSRYTVQCQRQAGLDPFVVTSVGFPRKDGFTDFDSVETIEGTRHYRIDPGPDYSTALAHDIALTDTAWLAARIARQLRPSVIHASTGFRGFETALIGLALRAHLRRPLVYDVRSFHETTWTGDIGLAEQGEHYHARLATEIRCMQGADLVTTIGEGMRAEIIGRGIPESKVFVVPNGVDAERFTPAEPPASLRARYRLNGKSVIGYVSNLDHPREGQEVLIEATLRLRARGRPVVCLLVGDGKRRAELEELARSGDADEVIFTGAVPHEQVRDFYALMDVFVVPRVDERAARLVTPLKPYEAMAMQRPMIVSDLPALTEAVKPDERGLVFAPGDAESLARCVETLLDHPDQARRFAADGRRWVLAERTWASNGPRYEQIYREVLDRWAAGERAGGCAA
jgi:glycosyltransferase involved in cell wall biosynthesis